MVAAVTDDGQQLRALNEVFVGHPSHQSARYVIQTGETQERHSSSGLIADTCSLVVSVESDRLCASATASRPMRSRCPGGSG